MDGERTCPPLKKRRISEQRFKLEYNAEWPTITRSKLDDFHAYCMLCKTDFSVRHGGRHDVEKHIRTAKHTSYKAAVEATRPIAGFFTVDSDTSVINAEVLAVDFLVEHNIPIAVADHIGPLVKKMFPDSKIAGKYGSGRTKSSAIVGALAKEDASVITEAMRTAPYSLATDGSTDYGDCKLYPLVVKYFDRGLGRVLTVLLSLPECHEASTGQNIFKLIDNELEKRSISWDNCMSFGADNAMVMQGLKAGTAGYINKKNSAVYVLGCPCHLIHLAAEKAAAQLPVSIEELLVDIYFYLDKSSKRKQGLKKFQDLCGVEMRKIVKHVSTRWLSLDKCIARLLQQWPALLQYFESEQSGHSSKDKTTQSSSKDKTTQSSSKDKTTQSSSKDKSTHSVSKDTSTHSSSSKDNSQFDLAGYLFRQQNLAKFCQGKKTPAAATTQPKTATAKPNTSSAAPTRPKTSSTAPTRPKTSSTAPTQPKTSSTAHTQPKTSTTTPTQPKTSSTAPTQPKTSSTAPTQPNTSSTGTTQPKTGAQQRVQRACQHLQDPTFHLYCYFLSAVLPIFDEANTLLQLDKPCIQILHRTLTTQLKNLLNRFVKPQVINAAAKVHQVPFREPSNQKSNETLFIGQNTRDFIRDHPELEELQLAQVFSAVRAFYMKAVEYMVKKFPYDDPVIRNASVADMSARDSADFNSVRYFTGRFPCLKMSAEEMDKLEGQFMTYQTDALPESITSCDRPDTQWHLMSQLKDGNGHLKYPLLCKVMLAILCIFHSNADCERIFSLVTKNRTEFRPSMGMETLSNLITHKQFMVAKGSVCYKQAYSKTTLAKAKSATYDHLK
ncbi:uncharacterized protein LOC134866984 [Eleginops maclovinus]|uniref:uncharacterized protein LOC134866984 n=1 Tax=Eleginops maclovinus TaxID=56733 RepID=UPI00308060A2